jgi:hypothetical protein
LVLFIDDKEKNCKEKKIIVYDENDSEIKDTVNVIYVQNSSSYFK